MEKSKGKPLAALILEQSEGGGDGEEGGDTAGEDMAAGEAYDAMKAGDREGFAAALKDCIRICMRRYGKPPAYSEEE